MSSSIFKSGGLLIILLIGLCHCKTLPKKRVCVIGAGRSGLAAIKLVADQRDSFEILAFERNSDVGGLWIYRDDPELDEHGILAHSGIYKNLKTNIFIGSMAYPDYQNWLDGPELKNGLAFPSHTVFLQYMRNYTEHFHLRKYIQFDTLVTKVTPVEENDADTATKWHLKLQDLNTGKRNWANCDAVMVCNGHFSKPYIPEIPGIESFPGKILHSRSYRTPEIFADKTILVLGAGTSGTAIASDLDGHAKKVYLSHRHQDMNPFAGEEEPKNVQVVPGVVEISGNELTLEDNSTITADTFIFCTGYSYDFPFLDDKSGIVYERKLVRPLYNVSINIEHPSMAFIGLAADYGLLYYEPSTNFLDLLKGELKLPSYEEMLKNSEEDVVLFDYY